MNIINADPRDSFSAATKGCNACCCHQATARPGETNKFMINYTAWAFPLGGRGLTDRVEFDIKAQPHSPDTRAPVNTNKYLTTDFNTPLVGNLAIGASDPLEGTLSFAEYDLFPPQRGEVVINNDGTFTYTPTLGFTGYDSFYVVTSNEAKSVTNQIIVGVSAPLPPDADPEDEPTPLPPKAFDKALFIVQKSVKVDSALNILSFALAASPMAVVGDVYKMEIKQTAQDCDCQEYVHISCYDITIVNC